MDVVIPARNEAATIGPIVALFATHPLISRVIVSVDADTDDPTMEYAIDSGATDTITGTRNRGKGQCVTFGLWRVSTPRVIFCDADLRGLTHEHITHLTHPTEGMIIGVPDFPRPSELIATGQPRKWAARLHLAWPLVSGQRSVPTDLARSLNLHGYLMEAQLNQAVKGRNLPIDYCELHGLRSPFILSDTRMAEMDRDRQWAIDNHIFKDTS